MKYTDQTKVYVEYDARRKVWHGHMTLPLSPKPVSFFRECGKLTDCIKLLAEAANEHTGNVHSGPGAEIPAAT